MLRSLANIFHTSNTNTLKTIYFAYFHSIIKYQTMLWGLSYSKMALTL
jgi:hypothetical protein